MARRRKGRKDAVIALIPDFYPAIPDFYPVVPDFHPAILDFYSVIPAKAGIQKVENGVRAPPPSPRIPNFGNRKRWGALTLG